MRIAKEKPVTMELARELARELHAPNTVDMKQFRRGIDVEMEHAGTVHKFAPTADMLEFAASVALDHLNENPRYYTILDQVGL